MIQINGKEEEEDSDEVESTAAGGGPGTALGLDVGCATGPRAWVGRRVATPKDGARVDAAAVGEVVE